MNTILVADQGATRTLTLNRPERRNALTPEMQDELIAALEAAAAAPGVRVVVLTGAGKSFCAGLDLSVLQTLRERSAGDLLDDARRVARLFRTLYEFPIPTIAVVRGHAMAGGAGLATLCDFSVAEPETLFGFTECRIGFVPALVSAYLTLQIGERRARELLLTARAFPATEAHALGLVTHLGDEAQPLIDSLLKNSPASLRTTKKLLADSNRQWLDRAVDLALNAQAEARITPDFHEGISAFLEKRSPSWIE